MRKESEIEKAVKMKIDKVNWIKRNKISESGNDCVRKGERRK